MCPVELTEYSSFFFQRDVLKWLLALRNSISSGTCWYCTVVSSSTVTVKRKENLHLNATISRNRASPRPMNTNQMERGKKKEKEGWYIGTARAVNVLINSTKLRYLLLYPFWKVILGTEKWMVPPKSYYNQRLCYNYNKSLSDRARQYFVLMFLHTGKRRSGQRLATFLAITISCAVFQAWASSKVAVIENFRRNSCSDSDFDILSLQWH